MAIYLGGNKATKLYLGATKIKVYLGSQKVWSGASQVTYRVDTSITYTEEVDEGMSVLSPTSFTPTKSGYTFLGWRDDDTATGTVHTTKVATGEPMTLYAVFSSTVTLTTYNGSTSATRNSKLKYYNNGNTNNPTFTLSENAVSGWTKRGWTLSASNYTASVADGGSIQLSTDATYYSLYSQTVYMGWFNNYESASIITESGNRFVNFHSSATYQHPTFSRTIINSPYGWQIVGWGTTNTSTSASYSSGQSISVSSGTGSASNPALTLYAIYRYPYTLTYYNNSSSASSTSGYQFVTASSSSWNYYTQTVTLNVASVSGWSVRGWSTSSSASATISYASGASVPITAGTLYASWSNTVTVSYNGNGATSGSTSSSSGTAYRDYKGTVTNASISLRANGFAKTSNTFYRWALNGASGTQYKAGASISLSASVTMYAYWLANTTTFNYSGSVASFTMFAGVTYLLKVYGAQGQAGSYGTGGLGGYAYGSKSYSANTTVYVCVGSSAGYNGGGAGAGNGHSGGGATHISTVSGGISTTTVRNGMLIVAGGGGGTGNGGAGDGNGGNGGGTSGGTGADHSFYDNTGVGGYGASQSSGGASRGASSDDHGYQTSNAGGAGYGGAGKAFGISAGAGGGGGGWYGGAGGLANGFQSSAGGGGGSAYTGGVTSGATSAGQRTGNGYAEITISSIA